VSAITWRATLLALDGDLDGALRLCERLRPLLGDERAAPYRDAVLITTQLETTLWGNDQQARELFSSKIDSMAPRIGKVMESPDPMTGLGELALYRLPCHRAVAKGNDVVQDVFRGSKLDPEKTIAVFAETVESCPSGLYHLLHGLFLARAGRLPEACAALRKAIKAPSVVPVARKARFELLAMLADRSEGASLMARLALQNEARGHLRALARDGVYPAPVYDALWTFARDLHDDALALSLSEAWRQRYPEDVKALRARRLAESRLSAYGREIGTLNTLLEKTPGDANLVNERGVAEYNRSLFGSATAAWFETLRLDPKQPNAAGNLTALESVLRRRHAVYDVLLEKLRMRAALILAHQGQHAEAVKAVATEKPEGHTAAALACLYAVAVRAAAADMKLTPEERSKRAEEYAVKSIDLLRHAQEAGYFKDPQRVKYLDGERDFDRLRTRDDFKGVMAKIKQ
jgi:hypothetical protein